MTKTELEQIAVRDHSCPWCFERAGSPCRKNVSHMRTDVRAHPHPERLALAMAEPEEDQ